MDTLIKIDELRIIRTRLEEQSCTMAWACEEITRIVESRQNNPIDISKEMCQHYGEELNTYCKNCGKLV